MARPKTPAVLAASAGATRRGRSAPAATTASAAVYPQGRSRLTRPAPDTDRRQIAKQWQIEAYRHINICGEARYAATLFAAIAGRAEIGISEPQALARKAVWVDSGPEVEVLAEIAPTVRDRTKLIRDFMLHRVIAGECYLIARDRVPTDPGYEEDPHAPVWEIVAVTELRKTGTGVDAVWQVRHENGNYLDLKPGDPVIRMWSPDPENRQEAWSPFRSLIPTLREIEWLTGHIFTQVRSRLMSAGVWFLPDNLTFPPPPPEAVEGGAEAIASMNEAEQFMMSLAASGTYELDLDEVSFPTVVMGDANALQAIDQNKLIKFWSDIDDKAMILRSDAVRRFALGMDLPPEQVLGSSGLAVTGAGGSAGSVNHWGVWANEEQTISAHIEPALDDFVGVLTSAVIRQAVENSEKVVAYDTASLRLRQDRSKEAIELYDRGVLRAEVMVREVGFDPSNDIMTPEEHKMWLLNKIVSGSWAPEQMQVALALLTGVKMPEVQPVSGNDPAVQSDPRGIAGPSQPPNLDDHPYEGPPRVQHDHTEAPFSALHASCEGLVLRALEKAGNRLLNDGRRGRSKDKVTPPHLAHLTASINSGVDPETFDFSMAPTVLGGQSAMQQALLARRLARFCADLYEDGTPYTRDGLVEALEGLA